MRLALLESDSGTVHVGHFAGTVALTLCGLHEDLKRDASGPVGCKRCRSGALERLRAEIERIGILEAQLDDAVIRAHFLRAAADVTGTVLVS